MNTTALSESDRRLLLNFFASMLWQDGELSRVDQAALATASHSLGFDGFDSHAEELRELPPLPDELDPLRVPARLVDAVLELSAQAARVSPSLARYESLELLELLLKPEELAPAPGLAA